MTRFVPLFFALFGMTAQAAVVQPASGFGDEDGWIFQGEDSTGVKLWKKEVPGSPVVAFRGETIIEASIPRLASVLGDSTRRTEWVADAKESRDIRVNTMMDRVEYNRTGAPWPVQDRDFVYQVTVNADRIKQSVLITINSVNEPSVPPRDGIVRAELIGSRYLLKSVDASHTRTSVEIHADPKGELPKWLVNMLQKNWPKTTLIRLARQVSKDHVVENPDFRAYFETGKTPDAWKKPAIKAADRSKSPEQPLRGV